MSANRFASLVLISLLVTCRTVTAETPESGKYRALLDTGESVVLKSARLTSDSLVGVSNGDTRSIPIQSLRSLDQSAGRYTNTGALIGTLLGAAVALVTNLKINPDTPSFATTKDDDGNVAPEIFAYSFGGGLLGIGVGLCVEKWQKVPLSGSISHVPERGEIRFQLSLAF